MTPVDATDPAIDDVVAKWAATQGARGIRIRTGALMASIEKQGSGFKGTFTTGDSVEADLFLYATGRAPNSKGIGLDSVGVAMDGEGAVRVDDMQAVIARATYQRFGHSSNAMPKMAPMVVA